MALQRRNCRTAKEHSPLGEWQSNGAVESAIRTVQGQICTLKLDLESKVGNALLRGSELMPWLVEWAAKLVTRYRVTTTGLSAFGNFRGRESRAEIANIVERVLYMPLKGAVSRTHKGEPRQQEGCFLGLQYVSSEAIIGTAEGIVRARSFTRVPAEEQWKTELLSKLWGTPDHPVPGSESDRIPIEIDQDGRRNPEVHEDSYDNFGRGVRVEQAETEERENVVRTMKVTAVKIGRYGTTDRCPGCEAYLSNQTGVTHNDDCRSRIRALMEKDESGQEELKKDAERVRKRTEDLYRREARKDPEVAAEEDQHDKDMADIKDGIRKKPGDEDDDADDDKGPSKGGERLAKRKRAGAEENRADTT